MKVPSVHLLVPSEHCKLSIFPGQWVEDSLWRAALNSGADAIYCLAPPPSALNLSFDVREIDAMQRLQWPEAATVCLLGVCSGSTLGLPLAWDLFHSAPTGSVLVFADFPALLTLTPLERSYYAGSAKREDAAPGGHTKAFRKVAPCISEADSGTTRWTFALPMERPNVARLNHLAARFRAAGLEETEFLICAPESAAAGLPEGWRLVPPPEGHGGSLTSKKNALVEAATMPNVCVFHDRLELPLNFGKAAADFGDHYGLLGFQNLFVDPGSGALSRYSDYHVELSDNPDLMDGFAVARPDEPAMFTSFISSRQQWRARFLEASITEFSEMAYLTGSLYMTKRSVWQFCGQAPAIDWNALEDVEFGHRAAKCGIPSRVNAHGFVRTIRIRPLLAEAQRAQSATRFGAAIRRPIQSPAMRPLPSATAVTSMSEAAYRNALLAFAGRWVPSSFVAEARRLVLSSDLQNAEALSDCLIDLVYLSAVSRNIGTLRRYISDFAMSCLCTSLDDGTLAAIAGAVANGRFLVDELITNDYFMRHIYSATQRPVAEPTSRGFEDRLEQQMLAAWRDRNVGIHFAKDLAEFRQAILATL